MVDLIQFVKDNPATLFGMIAILFVAFMIGKKIALLVKRSKEKKRLKLQSQQELVKTNNNVVVAQTPINPLGLEDFDITKFDLEGRKAPDNNVDYMSGLKNKADQLRNELEETGKSLTDQLTEVKRMEKEVADTVIILKNYFIDLRRKEEVLITTINTISKKR